MLERIFNKTRPHFEKGGRLEKLWPLFDAGETFLYRLPVRTAGGAHVRDAFDLKRMMMTVVLALVPSILFGTWNIGYQHYLSQGLKAEIVACFITGFRVIVPLYIVTFAVGGFWEALFAVIRREEINEGFFVTGFLIPLIVPPTIPLWQVAVAVSFGVVLGKEVFGGTGMNIFNPALVSRAFLFFAYPRSISGSEVWTLTGERIVDTYTMATPLWIGNGTAGNITEFLSTRGYDFWSLFWGLRPGSIGETCFPAIMAGALLLIVTGVGSWRIMASVFAGGWAMTAVVNLFAPSASSLLAIPFHYHMVMGGFAFGAVFMATDPVSAAGTNPGKFIYGFLIGALAILVRTLNPAYPEGMMLAILFMNLFAPLIDYIVVGIHVRRRKVHARR